MFVTENDKIMTCRYDLYFEFFSATLGPTPTPTFGFDPDPGMPTPTFPKSRPCYNPKNMKWFAWRGQFGRRDCMLIVYCMFSLSAIIPVVHFMVIYGLGILFHEAALLWLTLMAVLYLSGGAIYAALIPERFFPGKCDLWVSTEKIFGMHESTKGEAILRITNLMHQKSPKGPTLRARSRPKPNRLS